MKDAPITLSREGIEVRNWSPVLGFRKGTTEYPWPSFVGLAEHGKHLDVQVVHGGERRTCARLDPGFWAAVVKACHKEWVTSRFGVA